MNTSKLHLSRALVVLPVALSLSACVLGTKVGDLPDGSASAGETAAATDTDGASSSGGKDSSSGSTSEATGVATEGPIGTTTTGAQPGMCEGLDEATCMAVPACRPLQGSAYDFMGCPVGPQFLGCIPADMACDLALTTVCRDGTDEVYLNNDGCLPAGFSVCETPLPLCGSCESLTEAECLAEPQECQGLYGSPHVEQQGMVCVDFDQQVFLACAANGGACPPFVPTVCPKGDPSTRFDVPSGCIPFGFETCEGGTPACL